MSEVRAILQSDPNARALYHIMMPRYFAEDAEDAEANTREDETRGVYLHQDFLWAYVVQHRKNVAVRAPSSICLLPLPSRPTGPPIRAFMKVGN